VEVVSDGKIDGLVPATTNIKNGCYDFFLNVDPIYDIRGELENVSYIEISLEIKGVGLKRALEEINTYIGKIKFEIQEADMTQKYNEAQLKAKQAQLEAKQAQLKENRIQLERNKDAFEKLQNRLFAIQESEQELQEHITNMQNSLSWRLTKPLRTIKYYFKR